MVDFQTNAGVPNATIKFYITGLDATAGTVTTDPSGFYAQLLPPGRYNPRINGNAVDSNRGTILPVGTQYAADYFVNGGDCVMFYGTVRNATTGDRISSATIQFRNKTAQTVRDGSYRLEMGCVGPGSFGTGTTFMTGCSPAT